MGFFLDEDTGTGAHGFFLDEDPAHQTSQPSVTTTSKPSSGSIRDLFAAGIPFSDEIKAAGLTAGDKLIKQPLDWITGANIAPQGSWGEVYDQELARSRGEQKQAEAENPITSVVAPMVTGAATLPSLGLSKLLGGAVKSPGLIQGGLKAAGSALEGAGYGGLFGFAGGEGGVMNRLDSAQDSAALGGVVGGGIGAGSEVVKSIAKRLPAFAASQNRKSIGTRQTDYSKNPQTVEVPIDDGLTQIESKTKTSIDDLLENGKLGESRRPQDMLKAVRTNESELEKQIGGFINKFEQAQPEYRVEPRWTKTGEFINSGAAGEKTEAFVNRLENLDALIKDRGQGRLSYLQKQKIAKGKEWDPNDSLTNEFNRALYADMQRSIEALVPEVRPINAELGKFKTVTPILKRALAESENKDLGNRIIDWTKTTGGASGAAILGAALTGGNPLGFLIGGGIGLTGKYLTTPSGRKNLATISRASEPFLKKAGEKSIFAIPAGTSTLSSLLGKSPSDSQESTTDRKLSPGLKSRIPSPNSTTSQGATQRGQLKGKKAMTADSYADDPIIKAVISQESGGNAKAVSDAGAQGLMQILPSTAAEIAKDLGMEDFDLKDPQTNVKIGTEYLRRLLKEFGGDVELALTAYHSGPNRVKSLLARAKGSKLADIKKYLGPVGQKYAAQVLGRLNKA